MSKFQKGDTATIINAGQGYSNYDDMAMAMGIMEEFRYGQPYGVSDWSQVEYLDEERRTGTIVAVHEHLRDAKKYLCAIRLKDGGVHIYGEDGLKLVNRKSKIKLDDSLFAL